MYTLYSKVRQKNVFYLRQKNDRSTIDNGRKNKYYPSIRNDPLFASRFQTAWNWNNLEVFQRSISMPAKEYKKEIDKNRYNFRLERFRVFFQLFFQKSSF